MNRPLKIGILEGDNIGLKVVPEAIKAMRAAGQKADKWGQCTFSSDYRSRPASIQFPRN